MEQIQQVLMFLHHVRAESSDMMNLFIMNLFSDLRFLLFVSTVFLEKKKTAADFALVPF